MKYDLFALSPDAFERLLQAICMHALGAGTAIFGDGPDGGREAIFDGSLTWSPTKLWTGYTVIQAKAKVQTEGTAKDNTWAVAQLRKELSSFAKMPERTAPEFYIYATNVRLTAVAKRGGRDRCAALLNHAKATLGIKDYMIWDATQISAYIDAYSDIRRRFREWIVTSDLLESLIDKFGSKSAHQLMRTMCNYVQKELLSDQYSNLEQIGHEKDRATPLAKVFIDLPAAHHARSEPLTSHQEAKAGLLQELLIAAGSPHLAPSELTGAAHARSTQDPHSVSHFVIIGGPGQGKSTLGQFMCQLHRAAFLANQGSKIAPETEQVCKSIQEFLSSRGLALSNLRRLPFRVTLNRFAAHMANTPGASLLSYLSAIISRRVGTPVTVDELREVLHEAPSLIVLDGLDEVPASSNRADVLRALRDFWIDISEAHADVVAIATTRPQGYHGEFDTARYAVRYLAPLSTERALAYASSLLQERYPLRPDRREQLVSRLVQASQDGAVSRLLRSPLQATIMATLVERVEPPRQRWALFSEYYNVIYRRETERDLPASKVLTKYKQFIDAIHRVVGLRLQLLSEQAGSTNALLSEAELMRIADGILEADEYDRDSRAVIVEEIRAAATDRLVFLVARQENGIGFDIRSLQEFMAGEALVASRPDQEIQPALEGIAPSAHWRNVLLFAVGRIFQDKNYLRDSVVALCNNLNETDFGAGEDELLLGSQLATDLLYEGVAREQPKYVRSLARCALRLLSRPPTVYTTRLALAYDPDAELVFREEIERGIQRIDSWEHTCSWMVLLLLVQREISWATELAVRHRSALADRAAWSLIEDQSAYALDDSSPVHEQCWAALRRGSGSPFFGAGWSRGLPMIEASSRRLLGLFADEMLPRTRQARYIELPIAIPGLNDLHLAIVPLEGSQLSKLIGASDLGMYSEYWSALVGAIQFAHDPNEKTLSAALQAAVTAPPALLASLGRFAPWPLGAVLHNCLSQSELASAAQLALGGELGAYDDWKRAERRLLVDGISLADLEAIPQLHRSGLATCLRSQGFPPGVGWPWFRAMSGLSAEVLLECARSFSNKRIRTELARWAGALLGEVEGEDEAESCLSRSDFFLEIVNHAEYLPVDQVANHLNTFRGSDQEWVQRAVHIGGARVDYYRMSGHPGQRNDALLKRLGTGMDRYGWDPALARLVVVLSSEFPAWAAPRAPLEIGKMKQCPDAVLYNVGVLTMAHCQPEIWDQVVGWMGDERPAVLSMVCSGLAQVCDGSPEAVRQIQRALATVGKRVPGSASELVASAWNARCRVAQSRAGEILLGS